MNVNEVCVDCGMQSCYQLMSIFPYKLTFVNSLMTRTLKGPTVYRGARTTWRLTRIWLFFQVLGLKIYQRLSPITTHYDFQGPQTFQEIPRPMMNDEQTLIYLVNPDFPNASYHQNILSPFSLQPLIPNLFYIHKSQSCFMFLLLFIYFYVKVCDCTLLPKASGRHHPSSLSLRTWICVLI